MTDKDEPDTTGHFDVMALAATLPPDATTMLADLYLTDRKTGSARIFRVYKPVPAHYHESCDEYLYVLSGRGRFWMKNAAAATDFYPGILLCFTRNVVHAIPEIGVDPVVFLAIDTPRRAPKDIVFVDPEDGNAASFMARNADIDREA